VPGDHAPLSSAPPNKSVYILDLLPRHQDAQWIDCFMSLPHAPEGQHRGHTYSYLCICVRTHTHTQAHMCPHTPHTLSLSETISLIFSFSLPAMPLLCHFEPYSITKTQIQHSCPGSPPGMLFPWEPLGASPAPPTVHSLRASPPARGQESLTSWIEGSQLFSCRLPWFES
jgi:hypothetical protein